ADLRREVGEVATVEDGRGGGELPAVVDPGDLVLVGDHRGDLAAVAGQDLDHVGEVELALVVGVVDAAERVLAE
ncbi:hypothetical protein B9T16_30390, partial [Arthrospira sp. PCC 8006]